MIAATLKLWIVIYLSGQVGGVIGPIPFEYGECAERAAAMKASLDPSFVTPDGFRARDFRFACEWHVTRPTIQVERVDDQSREGRK